MKFRGYSSEIYLTKKFVKQEEWLNFINTIARYNGYLKKWSITITFDSNKVRYLLNTSCKLPPSINNLSSYLLKSTEKFIIPEHYTTFPSYFPIGSSLFDIYNYCEIKNLGELKYIDISFRKLTEDKFLSKVNLYIKYINKLIKTKMILGLPVNVLSVDFEGNKRFSYSTIPKYLDIQKSLHLLKTDKVGSLLCVDTFPYLQENFYLSEKNFDFAKHSLVLGASGCGKSKFLSLLINNIKNNSFNKYKIVMIDPHAAIEEDIGGLGSTIDFKTLEDSINLFASNSNDLVASTELTLELFKSLISDQYNSKLERVLRHSIYLLLSNKSFNFINLKKLILDSEYRTNLIKHLSRIVPISITDFFLSDFNDLKTKSYGEAISPLIAFIDEMELLPVFNEEHITNNLKNSIENNFLTLFSLNRTILGDKVTKTISGLLMQQLLTLIQSNTFNEHIIFVIDEVAVVENPILCRFLSEARKYNLSLILAGQYFNQISPTLKEAIFANVINYYIFRVSRLDATLLVDNLDIKIPSDDSKETKIKLLSSLNNRECIIRVSNNNILFPSLKAKTLDFISIPRIKSKTNYPTNNLINNNQNDDEIKNNTNFTLNSNISLNEILSINSTGRRVNINE